MLMKSSGGSRLISLHIVGNGKAARFPFH